MARNMVSTPDIQEYVLYTKHLVKQLYEDHGIKPMPVAWRRMRKCYARLSIAGSQIFMGHDAVQYWYTQGFNEYKTLQYLMRGRRPTGLAAVHQVILHEFAHVLQHQEPGQRTYGSVHNRFFVKHYLDLMRDYPFDEARVRDYTPGFQRRLLPEAAAKVTPRPKVGFPMYGEGGQLGLGLVA